MTGPGRAARLGDIGVAALLLAVVAMMIVPLPRLLVDLLLTLNITIAVLLLMAALFMPRPQRFASFPTILVVTTLFRVGLNVSTTRLILAEADAGEVVRAFGSAVVADNLVVGLVVFAVITIVQLLVVARGAERVAEVAARFALDAMPGRQQAIDADLRAELIDGATAQARRAELTRESQLHGAMDGAMRFVKGDAIAAILIVVINLVGGLIVGVGYRGMDASTAATTYSLLSVGEGLVAQIPSLLVAVASGLLVTRIAAASERELGDDLADHVLADPRALVGAGVLLLGLAIVPGMPPLPFALLGGSALAGGIWQRRRRPVGTATPTVVARAPRLAVRLGADLAGRGDDVTTAVARLARRGVPLPAPALLPARPEQAAVELVIEVDGAAAAWLRPSDDERVDALERALGSVASELIGLDEVERMVTSAARVQPVLVRETVPRLVALPALTEVVRALVDEGVPVADLAPVLAAVATAPAGTTGAALVDHVRAGLRRQISARWAPRGELVVYTLDPMIEEAVRTALDRRAGATVLALEPAIAHDIVRAVRARAGAGPAVVLASADLRRHVRGLLELELPAVTVLAAHELAPGTTVRAEAMIEVA
ncbi:MAG: FHIPEP family type III secretion protein [Kofleriaceae bacterium]|nr:FHIPEP family type III secretion protein [Kofleriaceae bacterium]